MFLYRWTYPVLVVVPTLQESAVYPILKEISGDCLIQPISIEECVDKLKENQNISNLILEIASVSVNERDDLIKTVSTIGSIDSIYLHGKPPEKKQLRNEFFTNFDKVCIFCEDSDQLAVQLVLDMASQCRMFGNQCSEANDKDTGRKHFQRAMDLYDGLNKFIGKTKRKIT